MGFRESKQPVNQHVQRQRDDQPLAAAQFVDDRASSTAQLRIQGMMNASPQAVAQRQRQASLHASPVTQKKVIQCREDEEPVQGKFSAKPAVQFVEKPNNTGLPNQLKTGIESLSGMSMDHVKVHYNSDKPAQLNAHAYAQGSDIHVAPGQEKHLPHEAWHVVQQAQGRVKPTMQMKGEVSVNDDAGLEHEADVMGAKALNTTNVHDAGFVPVVSAAPASESIQRYAYGPGKTRTVTVKGKNQTITFQECLENSVEYKAGENARNGTITSSPADWANWVKNNDGTRNATQMHVVNRRWGGLGGQKDGNITPGTPAENSEHSHQVESVFDQTAFGVAKANGTAAVRDAKYVCRFIPKYSDTVDVSNGDKQFADPEVWATIEANGQTEILDCNVRGYLTFTDPS